MAFVDVDRLVGRVEDALSVLELIVEDLEELRDGLKGLVSEYKYEVSIETVQGMIPEGLKSYLGFNEDEEYVVVSVQRRLNAEQFKAVVDVIGGLGSEYVSLGGTGYFRIPKRRA